MPNNKRGAQMEKGTDGQFTFLFLFIKGKAGRLLVTPELSGFDVMGFHLTMNVVTENGKWH